MSVSLLVVTAAFLVQCGRFHTESKFSTPESNSSTRYRVTLITDQPWVVGEAKWCSFDEENMEMHCFPPTPTAFQSSKHNYLVDADFRKPVQFDAQHWDTGSKSYPYGISCRLDSFEHATCSAGK
jgi:hypothetical protein